MMIFWYTDSIHCIHAINTTYREGIRLTEILWQKSKLKFVVRTKLSDDCFVVLQKESSHMPGSNLSHLGVIVCHAEKEVMHHMCGCAVAKHMIQRKCCQMHVSLTFA